MIGKVLKSWRDGNKYFVTKSTKYGVFTESVSPCEEDVENESQFDGYMFADIKCMINAYKEKAKVLAHRADGMQHLYNVMSEKYSYPTVIDSDTKEKVLSDISRQVGLARRDAEKAYDKYNKMREGFRDYTTNIINAKKKYIKVAQDYLEGSKTENTDSE